MYLQLSVILIFLFSLLYNLPILRRWWQYDANNIWSDYSMLSHVHGRFWRCLELFGKHQSFYNWKGDFFKKLNLHFESALRLCSALRITVRLDATTLGMYNVITYHFMEFMIAIWIKKSVFCQQIIYITKKSVEFLNFPMITK